MTDNFSNSQVVRKQVVANRGGVVAAQHRRAAEVGAAVLEAGGDAVDAAVATSFAIGVVEPWMSGPAAGGCMTLWRADSGRAEVVDYGMRSPLALNPADYPLTGDGRVADLFPWPAVVDDRNITGAAAVAVPGVVAGMDLAHRRHGRLPWRDLVQPAAALAGQGLIADWYSGLLTASTAKALSRDADAARMFLDDGLFAIVGGWTDTKLRHLDQSVMAHTLAQIADEGAVAFYRGDIAQALVRDVQAKGGCLALDDLAGYEAAWAEPLDLPHRGGRIFAPPGLTGGPTMSAAVAELAKVAPPAVGGPGAAGTLAMARALHAAFDARLRGMGDHEAAQAPGCTTHFSIVDRHGNFCSVTQTLLSIFGSRVVSPSTGLLLNNGIMWFDPEPGRPNSLGPGKRCLANYCPVVGHTADGRQFALGASGGRKILGAVLQLADGLIAQGLNLEAAFHAPRIDVSGNQRQLIADHALPPAVLDALRAEFTVTTARRQPHPFAFACPAGVERAGGLNFGCTETASPWGDAVGERLG